MPPSFHPNEDFDLLNKSCHPRVGGDLLQTLVVNLVKIPFQYDKHMPGMTVKDSIPIEQVNAGNDNASYNLLSSQHTKPFLL